VLDPEKEFLRRMFFDPHYGVAVHINPDSTFNCGCLWKLACKQEIVRSGTTLTQDREGKTIEKSLRRRELGQVLITSEGGLGITVLQNDDETLVRLDGYTTVDSSPDLRNRLLEVLAEEPSPRVITVDLAGVTRIEASAIATLIEALKVARHRQMTLCLQGLSGSALRLFEVTGVLALFQASACKEKVS
jgi:anti-anti-sigma factor